MALRKCGHWCRPPEIRKKGGMLASFPRHCLAYPLNKELGEGDKDKDSDTVCGGSGQIDSHGVCVDARVRRGVLQAVTAIPNERVHRGAVRSLFLEKSPYSR